MLAKPTRDGVLEKLLVNVTLLLEKQLFVALFNVRSTVATKFSPYIGISKLYITRLFTWFYIPTFRAIYYTTRELIRKLRWNFYNLNTLEIIKIL